MKFNMLLSLSSQKWQLFAQKISYRDKTAAEI